MKTHKYQSKCLTEVIRKKKSHMDTKDMLGILLNQFILLWLLQLPQTSVIKGTSDGRAIESLPDLCKLSKKVADAGILWALTYRIYPCISQPFFTLKSVQNIVLDLYVGQNFRPKRQLNKFCTISITIAFICYQTSYKQQYRLQCPFALLSLALN